MSLKFIDLFAGIGGFRIGMERAGYKCVFSSEIDDNACKVYEANFGDNPKNDITKIDAQNIPDFDVLCAGFPCQSFSISGKQKGFYDETRGTLFFEICRILEEKKPSAFILENVKNLAAHDKGRTLSIMMDSLNKLGYFVSYEILNAKDFGVPQNRERVIIVGTKNSGGFDFNNLKKDPVESMNEFLQKEGDFEYLDKEEYTLIDKALVKKQDKSGLMFVGYRNKKTRTNGVRPGTEHLSRVHKQPNRIYSCEGVHPTFSSQESSGRYFILLSDGRVRKLTIDECFTFMGFPKDFIKIGTTGNMHNRIGNSICINVVEEVAKELKISLLGENIMNNNPTVLLEQLFVEVQAKDLETIIRESNLTETQIKYVKNLTDKESTFKGVYTVLFTSLFYKHLHPAQDVRFHQTSLSGGYSGRSFDTTYITPFLKSKGFNGAMKESGWLTRSLEQKKPYTLNYDGAINNKDIKESFLSILHDISENNIDPLKYLKLMMKLSLENRESQKIELIHPILKESNWTISKIIDLLQKHFNEKYGVRGASILPVVAFYSVYETMINEIERYKGKSLVALNSHYSADKRSGFSGDISVVDNTGNEYEVVEIKFNIRITETIVADASKKIASSNIQRYYILSTLEPTEEEREKIDIKIKEIYEKHGCQIIVNGLIPTLKYYLRLISNTDVFLDNYIKNINKHPEIQHIHKVNWNRLMSLN